MQHHTKIDHNGISYVCLCCGHLLMTICGHLSEEENMILKLDLHNSHNRNMKNSVS